MPETVNEFGLNEIDGIFVIYKRTPDGQMASITLTKNELTGLEDTISSWKNRQIIQGHRVGSVQEIVGYPVSRLGFGTEALSGRALLTVQVGENSKRTYILEEHQVLAIALDLPHYVVHSDNRPPDRH